MKAHELGPGQRFRVVGLPDTWEVIYVAEGAVCVRAGHSEIRVFTTKSGDEIEIKYQPKQFHISRETSVEVSE